MEIPCSSNPIISSKTTLISLCNYCHRAVAEWLAHLPTKQEVCGSNLASYLCWNMHVWKSTTGHIHWPYTLADVSHQMWISGNVYVTAAAWQVARQRSDGDQLVVAGLGQLVMGVTFIPLFYGRAPLVATEREVLALFCTPTPWGRWARRCLGKRGTGLATTVAHH